MFLTNEWLITSESRDAIVQLPNLVDFITSDEITDIELATNLVQINGRYLMFCDEDLQLNEDITDLAMIQNASAVVFVGCKGMITTTQITNKL